MATETNNTRETVTDAVSYIGTAADTAKGLIKDPLGIVSNKDAASGTRPSSSGLIHQSERAFTVRPRSTPVDNLHRYTSDRGPIASLKLLSDQRSKADVLKRLTTGSSAEASQGLEPIVDSLMSDNGYADFLLTNVDVSFSEKVQVNEVFGDSEVVYYFGRSPVMFNLSGLLFDDVDNNWFYKFMVTYWSVLRGTQLAKNHQLAQINLPNMTVIGTISALSYSQDASRDTDIRFNMQFIAKSIVPRPVLLPSEMLTNSAMKLDLTNLPARFTTMAEINNVKYQVAEAKAYLNNSALGGYVGGVTGAIRDTISSTRGFFDDTVGGLFSVASLRANLLSPVYGVLTTLTKVVKSITGDILSLFGADVSIVGGIVDDVKSIANQAISLVNAVTGGINQIVGNIAEGSNDIKDTIKAVENAVGAVTSIPETVATILKKLTKAGMKSNHTAALRSGNISKSKLALINSGSGPRNSSSSAILQR